MGDDHSHFLASWVQQNKKLITYRLMSRERRIHVNQAKKAMQSFYDSFSSSQQRPHATFILIGTMAGRGTESSTLRSSQPNPSLVAPDAMETKSLLLVSEEKLQAARQRFSNITSCHIYSLQAGPLKDVSLLTSVEHDLHKVGKYVDAWESATRGSELGVIISPSIKDNHRNHPASGPSSEPTPMLKDVASSKVTPKMEKGGTTSKPTAGDKSNDHLRGMGKSNVSGLDWSKAKAKPTKAEMNPTSKRKSDSSSDDDDSVNKVKLSRRAKQRVALLGCNSEESDSDEDGGRIGSLEVGPKTGADSGAIKVEKSKKEQDKERKALEEMMEVDDDPGPGQTLKPSIAVEEPAESTETSASLPKKRVRKQRKVLRKERTKNEKGYTVTRDIEVYESYSSEESDPEVRDLAKKVKFDGRSLGDGQSKFGSDASKERAIARTKREAGATPAVNGGKKPSATAPTTMAPKKGQQSLKSFFVKKPKEGK
ncbi:hypothetical protein IE53DRAFT_411724 [Violaceomyces palustris]|uniref:Uncharacterized protein n=1 Tax=Violaceomyces palustris TaxID=1673888 RepID=A0ACD0NTZ7_9BASI|nr:hypothetical protein IE53DRAFT_411724 [Violaceomyces palustris]